MSKEELKYTWTEVVQGKPNVDYWNSAQKRLQELKNRACNIAGPTVYHIPKESNMPLAYKIASRFFSNAIFIEKLAEYLACFSERDLKKLYDELK